MHATLAAILNAIVSGAVSYLQAYADDRHKERYGKMAYQLELIAHADAAVKEAAKIADNVKTMTDDEIDALLKGEKPDA